VRISVFHGFGILRQQNTPEFENGAHRRDGRRREWSKEASMPSTVVVADKTNNGSSDDSEQTRDLGLVCMFHRLG
jgi:hypothetical protein